MKPVIPVACLAAGVAIGWFARPAFSGNAPAGPAAPAVAGTGSPASASKPAAAAPAAAAEEHHSSGRPAKAVNDEEKAKAAAAKQAGKKAQETMAARMTDLQRKKFEVRLAKLTADLNLTPEQQEKIRATMGDHFTKLTGMMDFDDAGTPEEKKQKFADLSAAMKNDGLDEATAGLLSDDQKAQYAAFKDKERKTRIESAALKDLGNVTNAIELTQEQRDGVFQALSDQAAAREDSQKGPNMMSMFTEGMGMQFDDELGIQDIMQEQMESSIGGGGEPDMKDMQKKIQDTMKQRTDARVEALKPYLTDAQLQQYRTHLETKAAGVLNMFGGTSGDDEKGQ